MISGQIFKLTHLLEKQLNELLDVTELHPGSAAAMIDALEEFQAVAAELAKTQDLLITRNREIAAAQRYYRDLFDNAPIACAVTDTDGIISIANNHFSSLLDVSKESVPGRNFLDFVHTGGTSTVQPLLSLNEGRTKLLEIELKTDQGPSFSALIAARPRFSPRGDKTGVQLAICKSASDIHSSEIFTLIECSGDPIMVLNADFTVRKVNKSFCDIIQLKSESMVGKPVEEVRNYRWNLEALRHALRNCAFCRSDMVELFVPVGAGRRISFEARKLATSEILLTLKKILDQDGLDQRLRKTYQIEAIANLADGVAHNFNNLLQIIVGGIQLALMKLESGKLDEVRRFLDQILERSCIGTETVRRLNDFARLGKDSAGVGTRVFDFSGLIDKALAHVEAQLNDCSTQKIDMDVELETTPDCFVMGKEKELVQVIFHLVLNAYEAQPEGGKIKIQTSIEGEHIVFQVQDNGMGIPRENLMRIFLPFWTSKGFQGRGMGLATTQSIVAGHNGDISVESKDGRGTTFTVRFPLARNVQDQDRQKPDKGLRILIIDDLEPLLTVLAEGLAEYGQTVYTATSGKDGIAIFRKIPIDVVLCDLGMESMDGWQTARQIKDICLDQRRRKVPFLIITGWSNQECEQKMMECGVDDIIQKPIVISNLLAVIEEVINPKPTPPTNGRKLRAVPASSL